jgi:hypothetical protein
MQSLKIRKGVHFTIEKGSYVVAAALIIALLWMMATLMGIWVVVLLLGLAVVLTVMKFAFLWLL